MLLLIAVALLSVAAFGGISLAALHFKQKPVPWPFSVGHGTLAFAGIAIVLVAWVQGASSGFLSYAIGILIAAACGGLFMAFLHKKTGTRPSAVVVIHGAAALIGVSLLAVAVFV